jgi:CHAT domain-containing protein
MLPKQAYSFLALCLVIATMLCPIAPATAQSGESKSEDHPAKAKKEDKTAKHQNNSDEDKSSKKPEKPGRKASVGNSSSTGPETNDSPSHLVQTRTPLDPLDGLPPNLRDDFKNLRDQESVLAKRNRSLTRQMRMEESQLDFMRGKVANLQEQNEKLSEGSKPPEDPTTALIHSMFRLHRYADTVHWIDVQKENRYQQMISGTTERPVNTIAGTDIGSQLERLSEKPNRTPAEEIQLNKLAALIQNSNQRASDMLAEESHTSGDTTSAIQAALEKMDPGTVAVYAFQGHDSLNLIGITRNAYAPFSVEVKDDDLQGAIADFLRAVRSPLSDVKTPAAKLYNLLIAPLAGFLDSTQAQTVLWSLSGSLRYLPLSALYDEKHHEYFVEQRQSVIVTQASIPYLEERPTDKAGWKGLAMGLSEGTRETPPLTEVHDELEGVVHDSNDPESHGPLTGLLRLNASFSLEELESGLQDHPQVVHLASHFILRPEQGYPYMVLGATAANGSPEHLTLLDMATQPRMSLEGTELLALSACDTDTIGRAGDGHEVDGLATAAHRQKAKAIIATLWPVNDASTAQLMTAFYSRWLGDSSISKAEALRRAQLTLLYSQKSPVVEETIPAESDRGTIPVSDSSEELPSGFQHPFFWAPFIMMGNPQ